MNTGQNFKLQTRFLNFCSFQNFRKASGGNFENLCGKIQNLSHNFFWRKFRELKHEVQKALEEISRKVRKTALRPSGECLENSNGGDVCKLNPESFCEKFQELRSNYRQEFGETNFTKLWEEVQKT